MRNDVKIITQFSIRCPEIPFGTAGRPSVICPGDLIEWQAPGDTITFRGRVIGYIPSKDNFVVICQLLSGSLYERWIDPKWVVNTAYCFNTYADKAKWFYGEEFLQTPLNLARNCSNLTYKQMVEWKKNCMKATMKKKQKS